MVGDDGDEECAHYLRIYVGCMHWAFGLLTGVIPYPLTMRTEDDYLERFTEEEILFNLLMVAFGALAWTYITAKILDMLPGKSLLSEVGLASKRSAAFDR